MITTAIITAFIFVWALCETITICTQKLHHIIKGYGYNLLEEEILIGRLNTINNSIISLFEITRLKGRYIAKTGTSILFPYYFSSETNLYYGILLFSKSYFLIKRKYKELKLENKGNKHLKF